ncbi:MAG: hypothetical protein HY698_10575 [Deltaproteobacteria bacterium]|nr:hypothetical protein [Deltaproteobacteria bacterium]
MTGTALKGARHLRTFMATCEGIHILVREEAVGTGKGERFVGELWARPERATVDARSREELARLLAAAIPLFAFSVSLRRKKAT